MTPKEASKFIKEQAGELGFMHVGISRAELMEPEARRLEKWLNAGMHGKMSYMENHFDKRVDPTKLVPGAKSVISLTYNYFNPELQRNPESPKISMYAYGEDYHRVIKDKLKTLFASIASAIGEISGRCFVDSAPILERDWARRSGLGWVGKHTLLISKQKGSFFFLAEIILDLDLEADHPVPDHCGNCTRCIDACPTDAISEDGYILDAAKCISYLTIELKDQIPDEFSNKMDNWMFGCDICQRVCPWNRFSTPHSDEAFMPRQDVMQMNPREWLEITEEVFKIIFKNSPVKRTKYKGLKRNISFLERNNM